MNKNAKAGLLVAAVLILPAAAPAQTPTPTTTPTFTPPTATAAAPGDLPVARFLALVWVDARPSWEPVEARIGDKVCGGETQPPVAPPGILQPYHHLEVASDAAIPGCGAPGATISFFIGGRQANETAIWYPSGDVPVHVELTVGAPFATLYGDALVQLPRGWAGPPGLAQLVPFVGDVPCGYQLSDWLGEGPSYGYSVIVYSQELKPGCGFEGAEVTLKLVNRDGSVAALAREKGIWHAMGRDEVALTLLPAVELANTGEGGPADGGGPARAVLGLAAVGLSLVGVGLVLRRRNNETSLSFAFVALGVK